MMMKLKIVTIGGLCQLLFMYGSVNSVCQEKYADGLGPNDKRIFAVGERATLICDVSAEKAIDQIYWKYGNDVMSEANTVVQKFIHKFNVTVTYTTEWGKLKKIYSLSWIVELDDSGKYNCTCTTNGIQFPVWVKRALITGATTTGSPTTWAPTTGAPTTGAPTTSVPKTGAPTTGAPTTGASTAGASTAGAPTTGAHTTSAPKTGAPTTGAPTTGASTAGVPTTGPPTAGAPITAAPTTGAPTTGASATGAPTTGAPATGAPTTAAPTTGAPTTGAPTTAAPTCIGCFACPEKCINGKYKGQDCTDARNINMDVGEAMFFMNIMPNECKESSIVTGVDRTECCECIMKINCATEGTIQPRHMSKEVVTVTCDKGAPTTGAPTTDAPITGAPPTCAPTTDVPTTGAPTTGAPTTGAPTTGALTTATAAKATGASTTAAPTTGHTPVTIEV